MLEIYIVEFHRVDVPGTGIKGLNTRRRLGQRLAGVNLRGVFYLW